MLLRRLIEHVKAQNWAAVGIDFVIVVLGVFIGIQVSNWNEARATAQEERVIIQRLLDEADESAREIDEAIDATTALRTAAVRAYEALQLDDLDQQTADQLRSDLKQLGGWKDEGYIRATLDQIVNSGKLSLIDSPSLQDMIAQHLEVIASATKAAENIGSMSLDNMTAMNSRLHFSFTENDREVITPTPALLADQELEQRIGHFAVIYTLFVIGHKLSVVRNDNYRAALEAYALENGWLD